MKSECLGKIRPTPTRKCLECAAAFDAGFAVFDAGAAAFDAGFAAYDAGFAAYDAGFAVFDAGSAAYRWGPNRKRASQALHRSGSVTPM